MLGNGLPPEAVELTLSQKFPAAANKEIGNVIRWAMAHNPQPSHGNGADLHAAANFRDRFFHRPPAKPKPNAAAKLLQGWLNGRSVTEEDLYAESPVKPDRNDFAHNALIVMECLYSDHDCLNIVCDHRVNDHGKANPHGPGKILPSCRWCEWFHKKGVPQMKAGAWLRPNPVREAGTGFGGAIMDADVVAPRFLLLESDSLPFELQLAAIASFRLPVAAVLTSGGASYHAWVHLNCHDLEEYGEQAERILRAVGKFGFDTANKNPSRLSRLPGAIRQVKPQGDGKQRLLYLNPSPKWRPICG